MTVSVLFVDDSENILQGLRRNMRSARQWNTRFALGGEEALKTIASEKIDVIVSDIRMPKTDGSELLKQVKQDHPETIRMVLSGQCEEEVTLKLLEVSHQYMAKPCPPETIISTISPILAMRADIKDEALAGFLTGIASLPTLPDIYNAFTQELKASNPNKKVMEELASRDISMVAKLLQIMNSSYFGPSRDIVSLSHMWELLSLDKINTMMSQDHLMYSFPSECAEDAFLHKLWKFSYYTAQISRLIAESEKLPEKTIGKAYVSGLLQAIGAVAIYEFNRQKRTSLSETEIMAVTGGNSYSAAGGYLLCLWGLHQNIFNVVRHHLNPGPAPHETDKNLLGIVHVAAALARSKVWPDMTSSITIDNAFLKGTGAHEKLQGWQNIARAV